MSGSDRFQLVTVPMAPGICRTCGAPFGMRPLFDTGLSGDFCNRQHYNPHTQEVDADVDINQAGTVYLCESCIVNLGMLVGMLPSYKTKQLKGQVELQREAIANDEKKILGLEQIVDGYHTVSSASLSNPFNAAVVVSDAKEDSSESRNSTNSQGQLFGEKSDGTDSGESKTGKPVSVSVGPRTVSRDSSSKPGKSENKSSGSENEGKLGF